MDSGAGLGASYAPGEWVAITGQDCWLLVALAPADPMVLQSWQVITAGGQIEDVLDVLLVGGLRAVPEFVLVGADALSQSRLMVRGSGSLWWRDAEGTSVEIRALPGTSWIDLLVPAGVEELILTAGSGTSDLVELPLSSGVTSASLIRVAGRARPLTSSPSPAALVPPGEADLTRVPSLEPNSAPSPDPDPTPELGPMPALEPDPVPSPEPDPTPKLDLVPPPEPVTGVTPLTEPDDRLDRDSYDFLFGATRRPREVDDLALIPEVIEPEPLSATPIAAPVPDEMEPSIDQTAGWFTQPPPAVTLTLIDSVPGYAAPASLAEPASPEPPRTAAAPAPEPLGVGAGGSASEPPIELTVSRAGLAAAAAAPSGPTVLAARCPKGHLSPVHANTCRVCRASMPLGQPGVEIPRPVLGILRFSNGDVVRLDRGALIGRVAQPADGDSEDQRHQLRLPSDGNFLSGNHAEIVLDGWNVYVRDLGSTNGTTVTLPGQPSVALRAHDLFGIEPGSMITLADEITIAFEVET